MFMKIIQSEWLKFRKSNIWLLLFVSPLLAALVGLLTDVQKMEGIEWYILLSGMLFVHGLLFLPLLTGVFSAFVTRYEHQGGGWKQLLALPVSRLQVYLAKGTVVMIFLAITQFFFIVAWYGVGMAKGMSDPFPIVSACKIALVGWLACLPLAALQLWISTAWVSFAAPLAINVIFTMPNILVANSEKYAPFYPWVQPFLTMLSAGNGKVDEFFYIPIETLLYVVLGSFLVFLCGGLLYFQRKAV
ncbi:ABC transporter permease [Lederbergia lenta]|uniref:ABC transporter permease n=1 Tax=Lederbergia lenta TaxID=1467 RepID=UPI00203B40BB|nr:ABC transporter permease [Lederbergia lenta]MCM3112114.1 ABC transporter permease [Lederbergia lenta]